jgi:hypothetical protein
MTPRPASDLTLWPQVLIIVHRKRESQRRGRQAGRYDAQVSAWTGTDHRPQKKAKPKRGNFRKEVNAALSARCAATGTISESLVLPVARDSSLKRTISGRTSPQTLYVSLLTQTHVRL